MRAIIDELEGHVEPDASPANETIRETAKPDETPESERVRSHVGRLEHRQLRLKAD